MNSPIELTGAQPRFATGNEPEAGLHHEKPRFDPYTGKPLQSDHERIEEQFISSPAELVEEPAVPANPYAPTGWKRRHRVEFDMRTPVGNQLCRLMRLEREDLFRLNLMQYLDTFTPLLLDGTMSDEARDNLVKETIQENPDALANMFIAIDQIVMAATVKPRVTNDEKKVDYGKPKDWANPSFVATVHVDDIVMEDRMAIFGAAFGRSMDDLKSVLGQAPGLGSVADESGIQSAP